MKKASLIPFIAMPIAYIYAMEQGLHTNAGVLAFAINLSWLPIAICVLRLIAIQRRPPLFAEIGMKLHIVFSSFVCSTYYFSLIVFVRQYGFVNKSFQYRSSSIILVLCIALVFFDLTRCKKGGHGTTGDG